MKHKVLNTVKILVICMAGVAICFGLYHLVDDGLNGTVVDWFEKNYMLTTEKEIPGANACGLVREPIYPKVKTLVFTFFSFTMLFGIMIVSLVSYFHAKSQKRKTVTQISRMIHDFINNERSAVDLFPKEYAEISAQMAEIKSSMQQHEQLLKEEATRKNDLITYLAHDLKTPLTSVIGYISLLDEAPDMPTEQRAKYVHIALEKAQRLEKLINEFFDITRYNLQHIELEKETIDLSYMFVQMTDEFYPLFQAHGNTVELSMDEDITIYGDAEKLARVFNNILKNAVSYSYPNTKIRIWADKTDTDVKIYIQNSGKTISPRKLESIFEKFFRLDDARSSNTGGAGLGLAIAKEIVSLHGGTINASSQNEIMVFCVTLPLGN